MNEQTAISGSLALNSAPHVIMIPASGPVRTRKLRVAAYARVSSNSEDQIHSFAAQNAYYTELITGNPEWEFVDVYWYWGKDQNGEICCLVADFFTYL